jgi:hypothetical protein
MIEKTPSTKAKAPKTSTSERNAASGKKTAATPKTSAKIPLNRKTHQFLAKSNMDPSSFQPSFVN